MKNSILVSVASIILVLCGCAEMRRDKYSTAVDIVNQATETVQRFKGMPDLKEFANYMPTARGIVVLPSVVKGGFMLGHGSVVSIPETFSMVKYIHHLFKFSSDESCGKCFPGRLGSYRGKEMFDQALNKSNKIPMKLLNELLITMKKGCLCALCGAIPVPISNILKYFTHEFKDDIKQDA